MKSKPQIEYIEANGTNSLTIFLPGNDGYAKHTLSLSLDDPDAESQVATFLSANQIDKNAAFDLVYCSDKSFTSSLVLPKVSRYKAKQLLEKEQKYHIYHIWEIVK